jgi:DNA-binding NtrC family response regulator
VRYCVIRAKSVGVNEKSKPPSAHQETQGVTFANAQAGAIPLKVLVTAGIDEGREVALAGLLEVGTDKSAGFVLTDPAVSRKHLLLSAQAGKVVAKDLGSRNGTFFGGARVHEIELAVGAVLTVGHTELSVQSRFYVREVAPSTARVFGDLFGESVAMREVFAILERAAMADVTVLIEGESGTGKELAARSIHTASARKERPYVVFDCGSVPSELAESELFGHKKGAFSGATSDRLGAFQQAHGGTLCLDELGELPLELQPKLLRVLETGEVRPVGSDTSRKVDVRVLASTNRDLLAESKRGRFRSDLYYRLEVVRVRMPPLRQRPEDIPGLVAKLLAGKLVADDKVAGHNLRKLVGYAWPGNVRELRNVLTRAVTMSLAPGSRLATFDKLAFNLGPVSTSPSTIGAEMPGMSTHVPYKEAREQVLLNFEQLYVSALLERHGSNVTKAAAAAGLSRKHLHELIKKLGHETPQGSEDE